MSRVITIDPGKSKCGLVLAEISEKKVYKAIILKSELLGNYVRNLITAEEISQIIIGNGTNLIKRAGKCYKSPSANSAICRFKTYNATK